MFEFYETTTDWYLWLWDYWGMLTGYPYYATMTAALLTCITQTNGASNDH